MQRSGSTNRFADVHGKGGHGCGSDAPHPEPRVCLISALRQRTAAFGIGLRRPHFDTLLDDACEGVDFLEVLPENFMDFGGRPQAILRQARERFPIVLHGVGLSIGSIDPLDERYLASLERLVQWVNPPWFSDHLSYASAFGVQYHDLLPLPYTMETVRHVAARVAAVQDRFDRPFLLENPSLYVRLPGAEMDEPDFVREVAQASGCGLLLDVNNVYVNSQNHHFDPYAYIDRLPLDRVLQIHVAGHDASGPFIVDTHGAPVCAEVFALYRYTMERVGPVWTLLERDNEIPSFAELLAENAQIRRIGEHALAQAASPPRMASAERTAVTTVAKEAA